MCSRNITMLLAALLSFAAGCQKQPPKPVPSFHPTPGAAARAATGRAAIPQAAPNGRITEAQVRDYVLSHPLPRGKATNVAIVSTSFITHQQVRELLHSANLGLPDQEPMCVVILRGNFAFSGPPNVAPTFPYAVEVFDARTGNLLQAGGLPRLPQQTATATP